MLDGARLMAFVPTSNLTRAMEFYGGILGLRLLTADEHGLVFETAGSLVRVVRVQDDARPSHTVVGWIVPDVRASVIDLRERGVDIERYDGLPQDDDGIASFGERGPFVAWFRDLDGNTLSLTQVSVNARRP